MLVLVRHGESQWNLENRFTGDVDVELTPHGEEEARLAGEKLEGIHFGLAFTSALTRAQHTLNIILGEIGQPDLEVVRDKALNERNYGDLQGLNKTETALKFGEEQVHLWRRSYNVRPPNGESLADTANRVIPYYKNRIEPLVASGDDVLIVAHGNSLRALMMYLENLDSGSIAEVNIPTGVPRRYEISQSGQVLNAIYL